MTIARRENLQIQLTNVNELIGEANCEAHRLELVSRYQKVILGKFATVGSFVKAADAISHGYGNGVREDVEKYELMDNCNASVDYAKCKEKCGKRLACGHEYLNECHECQKLSSQISGDTNVPIERAHHGKCVRKYFSKNFGTTLRSRTILSKACKVAMRFCWLKSNRRETLSEMQKLIKLRDLINQLIVHNGFFETLWMRISVKRRA
ncbi:hypothetical protein RhiirA1_439351 [Rhizophagus irregularis]|uniref:Uncharacterized protein n=1 Tax=Rhizophagus irregularis TaxID=588596 RepID=A0A2N0S518_9GLOM|nr:hypothetical protein RhiirA1_439351 [Rhizophagus irregularis]